MTRRRALVVCPGRGTYNKTELGYLTRHHGDKADLVEMVDDYRRAQGQTPVSDLDRAERYSNAVHTRGDNASPLIYACAYADYLSIDRDAFDIVAVTGNSMGWYIALACAAAATAEAGLTIVNTMGRLMHEASIGGQTLYPVVDENWREIPGKCDELLALMRDHGVGLSIDLGGMLVFAGDESKLAAMEAALSPVQERYPLRLHNHAAFHTALQAPVAQAGQEALGLDLFGSPQVPMIDGRGHIWRPRETRANELRDYTLGHQVTETYDFSRAIRIGVKEFAPDALIILGPGATLGGAVAQSLIGISWRGLIDKASFQALQQTEPYLLSMGIEEQRAQVSS